MASRTSLASRLLLPLLLLVGGVMAAFAVWALVQRERTLIAEARRETQAYATALGLALDAAFQDPDRAGVPAIVRRISLQPSIYGVVVYDLEGRPVYGPGAGADSTDYATPEQVREVLRSGRPGEFERAQDDVDVYSVVRAIEDPDGRVVGAFEVLQPLSFVNQEQAATRVRFALNTLVLLASLTLALLWLVRRLVSEPLARFAEGVRALGSGQLDTRVDADAAIAELASVAAELNRMAAGLEQARTELLRGTEERLLLERQIRQAEKMAIIGQLAAGLAHEIGAPLHVIRGRADLMARRHARAGAESRDLSIIVQQIDRITRIVRSLLDFARPRERRPGPVDLVPLIDETLELVSMQFDAEGIELGRTGAPRAVVHGDRDALQQVLLNLLLNAQQAMSREPDRARPRAVTVDVGLDDAGVRVDVRDSGPGIAPEHRAQVFEPFFTTKADGGGTGLGLAVARLIIEEHGGVLELIDDGGPGTCLTLALPAPTPAIHAIQ
ncbi:MAG: ATP-binding protein [Gemmatimonadota bacterium]|nr:sensor histidine kinase [Gemmatimonadota bacterium]